MRGASRLANAAVPTALEHEGAPVPQAFSARSPANPSPHRPLDLGVVLDRAHHINIDDRHVEWPSAGITTGRPMKSRVPDVLRNIENFKRTFEPYRS
jgi:hypothetical protein